MKNLKTDAINCFVSKIRVLFLITLFLFLFLYGFYYEKVEIAFSKPVSFLQLQEEIKHNPEINIENYYVEMDIEMITGSFGEYGRNNNKLPKAVYYVTPVEDGNKVLSILAPTSYIEIFDKMEKTFYQSVETNKNKYEEKILVKGSLRPINEIEKDALYMYIKNKFGKEDVFQLESIASNYVFTIDEIQGTNISFLHQLPII